MFYQSEIKLEQPKLTGTLWPRLEQEKSTDPSSSSRLTLEVVERSPAQGDIATSLKCKAKQIQPFSYSIFAGFRTLYTTLCNTAWHQECDTAGSTTPRGVSTGTHGGSLLMGFVTGNAKQLILTPQGIISLLENMRRPAGLV